jgi:hypothetical protein
MKQVCFELPTIEQVEFTIQCMPEDIPIKGNAIVSGDDEYDKEVENDLIEQLENGNEWAWCAIKVTACYKGQEGTDYLGGCSYKSKKDFIESNDYYQDMRQQAYDELIAQLESLQD